MREKCRSPSVGGSTLQTNPWIVPAIQQRPNVAAAPASSQPAQVVPEEGAEGSPSPRVPPVGAGRAPVAGVTGGSARTGSAVIHRRSCSSVGIKPSPASRAGRNLEQTFLRKGGAGQPSQSKHALREGCGKEGTGVSQQTLAVETTGMGSHVVFWQSAAFSHLQTGIRRCFDFGSGCFQNRLLTFAASGSSPALSVSLSI